jgi:hypothetical protein
VKLSTLILRSGAYHWRTNLAMTLGVAVAASVLAGALLVGDSVRASLRDIAIGRLGRTDTVATSMGFFREALADDLRKALTATATAPLIVADGFVTLESSGRRASNVLVYGVDERFWAFHGLAPAEGVLVSPSLAAEVGAKPDDVLLTRLQKPSQIPVESLFGRKDDIGRTVRLTVAGTLPADRLGEFSLRPQQAGVRAIFAPLRRIQRDLAVPGQVNTVLVNGGQKSDAAFKSALTLEDLGAHVLTVENPPGLAVESASGIVSDGLAAAVRSASAKLGVEPIPIFTYLANTIRNGDRQVPYSLITATDLTLLPRSHGAESASAASAGSAESASLNEWAARELAAKPGDRIEVDYYLWDATGGLSTQTVSFTLQRIVPIEGLAADRHLAPDYPGITAAKSLADWDPPFPIDLSRVRPQDDKYWQEYRTTPKAFIPYARGRELWRTRYGEMTSLRLPIRSGVDPQSVETALRTAIRETVSPEAMGVTLYAARAAALEASRGATDFGEYFTYFSFFLVVSALMLAVLFFKLGVEQRLRQIGILRAAGYPMRTIRRLLLGEALVVAIVGAIAGSIGAVVYGEVIIHGLRTWWIGAVGTTLLRLHVSPVSLAAGVAGGVLAAIVCVAVSLRSVGRLSPRTLLSAQTIDTAPVGDTRGARRRKLWAILAGVAAAVLVAFAFTTPSAQAGAFFGAGAALLVAVLMWFAGWLRSRDTRAIAGRGPWAIARLGFRSAASRPARSVLSAALIASAAFIIVSVEAFRRAGDELTTDPRSGTGGYVLFAQSELPILHNVNDAGGRSALMIQAPELANVRFTRFRVRQGQDASCLNLYRPTNPTIIAPEASFIDHPRFSFGASMAQTEAERANPWLLLARRFDDGAAPIVADATSLEYVLHARVGDSLTIDTGAAMPLVLRFVAALQDSVLQGELVMGEDNFIRLFPHQQGYRLFLVDDPDVRSIDDANRLAGTIERELQPFGLDATVTSERLAEFHRVENTYLSTFQALGGLGLLLGTVGLATVMFRNVLERRRELALLRAVGFDARRVSTMILAEAAFLLGVGVVTGLLCAAIAIAPAWLGRGGSLPGSGIAILLLAVVFAGVVSSIVATRAALSGNILEGLRAE